MPNWVDNTIQIKREDGETILETIRGETAAVDFRRIIPMSNKVATEIKFINGKQMVTFRNEDGEEKTMLLYEAEKEHGLIHWYSWCCENWGTKWNACDSYTSKEDDIYIIGFRTAWSHPYPIIKALSEMFPSVVFDVRWEEEQGYGAIYSIENGKSTMKYEWASPQTVEKYKGIYINRSEHPDRDGDYLIYAYDSPNKEDGYDDLYFKTIEEARSYIDRSSTKN